MEGFAWQPGGEHLVSGGRDWRVALWRPGKADQPIDVQMVDSEISAIGVYSYFHLSALQKASRLAKEPQLASLDHHTIRTTSLGKLLVRNVCMIFDRYHRDDATRFSSTI